LGCDIFRAVREPVAEPSNAQQEPATSNTNPDNIFTFRDEGFAAEMYVSTSGEFVVTQGSSARIRKVALLSRTGLRLG